MTLAYVWLLGPGRSLDKRGLRPQIDVRNRRYKSYAPLGRD